MPQFASPPAGSPPGAIARQRLIVEQPPIRST
jgi:hypothetical protein